MYYFTKYIISLTCFITLLRHPDHEGKSSVDIMLFVTQPVMKVGAMTISLCDFPWASQCTV